MQAQPFNTLLVEDDQASLDRLRSILQPMGLVSACHDLDTAYALLAVNDYDLVMVDLHTGGKGELSLLQHIKRQAPNTVVIIITDSGSVDRAVEAMRLGAFHYLTKPYSVDNVAVLVDKAREKRLMRLELEELRDFVRNRKGPQLIGKSEAMQSLKRTIMRVAPLDCTVLITGETGTGKELISRSIHTNSKRADKSFFAVNCGAFSEDLLSNELFGHEKEAFTGALHEKKGVFESHSGGTVLLDEVGDAPPSAQVQLLRVLQENTVTRVGGAREVPIDVRVIAATNRSLEADVAAGSFRQDLYYRLNVVTIRTPPLRERKEDIPLFCRHFLAAAAERYGMEVPALSAEALEALMAYDYPGNVRELKNILERGVILSEGPVLDLPALPRRLGEAPAAACPDPAEAELSLAEVQARHIARVLSRTGGNKSQAARILGITRASLYRKLSDKR